MTQWGVYPRHGDSVVCLPCQGDSAEGVEGEGVADPAQQQMVEERRLRRLLEGVGVPHIVLESREAGGGLAHELFESGKLPDHLEVSRLLQLTSDWLSSAHLTSDWLSPTQLTSDWLPPSRSSMVLVSGRRDPRFPPRPRSPSSPSQSSDRRPLVRMEDTTCSSLQPSMTRKCQSRYFYHIQPRFVECF